jgi:diaminopimelate decarboxylase
VDCRYLCEPGQIIANDSLHIVLRVRDVKDTRFGIADGGTNIIGVWEKYEDYYAPVLNLTHPSTREVPFTLYGNLCTPHDVWGYYCYAAKVKNGDVMLIPFQGAYTHTFANAFIKPIPPTYRLGN